MEPIIRNENQNQFGTRVKELPHWIRLIYQGIAWFGLHIFHVLIIFFIVLSVVKICLLVSVKDAVKIDSSNIFVSDNAHLLTEETKKDIYDYNQTYATMWNKPQFIVITLKEIPFGRSIEEYTYQKANELGVGSKEFNSGVVYLLSTNERQSRLEIGNGMLNIISPEMTDDIVDETVKDAYRNEDYNKGIALVATRINQLITEGKLKEIPYNPTVENSYVVRYPGTYFWTFLNKPRSHLYRIVFSILLCIVLYVFYNFARKLKFRIYYDDLIQHYLQETNEGTESKEKINVNERAYLDFCDMDFAFGELTKKEFLKNALHSSGEFKTSSVYLAHKEDWFKDEKVKIADFAAKRFSKRNPKEPIQEAVLKPLQFTAYHILSVFLKPMVWIALGFILSIYKYSFLEASSPFIRRLSSKFYTNIKPTIKGVYHLVFNSQQSLIELILMIVVILSLAILASFLSAKKIRLKKRFQLNKVGRLFLENLNQQLSQAKSPKELIKLLTEKPLAPVIVSAKKNLDDEIKAGKHKGKNSLYPDYYDMSFGYGKVTNTSFFAYWPDDSIKQSSLYANHKDDWYRKFVKKDFHDGNDDRFFPGGPPYNDSNHFGGSSGGGSSGGSSGGGGFGGGGFGGSGGTSGW